MSKQTFIENKVREATEERHKRSGTKTAKSAELSEQSERCAEAKAKAEMSDHPLLRVAGTLARAGVKAFGRAGLSAARFHRAFMIT
jgi:hypothetical protein